MAPKARLPGKTRERPAVPGGKSAVQSSGTAKAGGEGVGRVTGEQLRAVGAAVCSFANAGCLCKEKGRPLCRNVHERAEQIIAIVLKQ
jgi:hypothetical protein